MTHEKGADRRAVSCCRLPRTVLGSRQRPGGLSSGFRRAHYWILGTAIDVKGQLRRAVRPDLPSEPELVRVACRLVGPGAVCVDVGANVGAVSEPLARAVGPEGRVIAFEAHPVNVTTLARAMRRKRLSWVTIEPVAVTDGSSRTVMLYSGRARSRAEWNVGGRTVSGEPRSPEVEVASVSLDAFFSADDRVDLVKIDVEGAEGAVLDGMRDLVARARPVVITEFHDDANWAKRTTLVAAGYVLFDTSGNRLPDDATRSYHVVALPTERSEELFEVAWPDLVGV
jgi:FkbM family methyltransferase